MITRDEWVRRFDDFCGRNNYAWAYARPLHLEHAGKTGDIDIIVPRDAVPACVGFLRAQKDIQVIQCVNRVDGVTVFLYGVGHGFTHIDFTFFLGIRGVAFAQTHEMTLRVERHGDWVVLHPVDQAVLLVMTHGVKHGMPPKPDYVAFIARVFRDHDDALSARLLDIVGGDAMMSIREAAMSGDMSTIRWRALRRGLLLRGNVVENMARAVWHSLADMECRLFAPKTTIAFFGVDGAGKTTLIHALKMRLDGAAHVVRHCHFLPLWPWQKEPDSSKVMSTPHARNNRGVCGSMAKAFYVWARYVAAYAWPWRGSVLFVFDRHMADMLVDPRRYRYRGPRRFLDLLLAWSPRPDVSVLVDIDPHIAHRRKPELPLAEMRRQADAYRALAGHIPNFIKIDGTVSVDENTNLILRSFLGVKHG
jgi:hypothetical protein